MSAPGDLVQCRIIGDFDGQPIINNLSFDLQEGFLTWTATATAVSDALDAAIGCVSGGGSWSSARSSLYTVKSLQVIDVLPGLSPLFEIASADVGDGDAAGMPPNDALCVTLRSDFKGASGRGRMYLGGWPRSLQQSGFWVSAAQDAASGLVSSLTDAFGESGSSSVMRWAVLHRFAGGAPVVPPEVKPIMSTTIHNEVRSLSRRAMGRRISRRTAP